MIEAGLDAINISVDAVGQGGLRDDARRPRSTTRSSPTSSALVRLRERAGHARGPSSSCRSCARTTRPTSRRSSSTGASVADKIHITDLHNWAGTLNAESDVQLPVLPAVADVHGAVGRPRVALLRRLRRPHDPRRPAHVDDPGDLERRRRTAPCAGSTSRAAAPTSAGRATCRRRTRRSGSRSCCSAGPDAER